MLQKLKFFLNTREGLGLFLGILGYKEFSRELVFVMVWCWRGSRVQQGIRDATKGGRNFIWNDLILLPLFRFLTTTLLLLVGFLRNCEVCLVCCLLKSWVSDFLLVCLLFWGCSLRSSPFKDSEVETEAVTRDSVASSDSIIMPSCSLIMPSVVVVSWIVSRFSLQNSI